MSQVLCPSHLSNTLRGLPSKIKETRISVLIVEAVCTFLLLFFAISLFKNRYFNCANLTHWHMVGVLCIIRACRHLEFIRKKVLSVETTN